MHSRELDALVLGLQNSRGLAHKRDISTVVQTLGIAHDFPFAFPANHLSNNRSLRVGDDCAAIPDPNGDGYLLFAIEGFLNEFVRDDPWFAGWCGVMVNVSDIYAMGGRPLAVVDAIWDRDSDAMSPVLNGLAAASKAYNVPIVGGHSNARNAQAQLAVAILGRAKTLLTSFDAKPGDVLIAAIDLRAQYREPFSNWSATAGADPQRLRDDLEILPLLAEAGLCKAAKDISQAGILGTLLMLLECSGVGAMVDVNAVPRPVGIDPQRWLLSTFPSYGFLLAVPEQHLQDVLGQFDARDISCAPIGRCDSEKSLRLHADGLTRTAWSFEHASVIGCGAGVTFSHSSAGENDA